MPGSKNPLNKNIIAQAYHDKVAAGSFQFDPVQLALGETFDELFSQFSAALDSFFQSGDASEFRPGIESLLIDYYDPMYDYQKGLREGREIFRGEANEFVEWANEFTKSGEHPLINT